jgi:queuosine precursor transporter
MNQENIQTHSYRWYPVVVAVFVTCLLTANIIAVKPVQLGGLVFPAAVVIFPVAYIFGDILTEVYGYARARQTIWIGFACNLIAVVAMVVGGLLPAAGFWPNQSAYDAILGFTPRLLIASFIAYLAGEFLNSFVLAKMKVMTSGRFLWMRTIGSTLIGELADSAVFITVAFSGIWPPDTILTGVITQWLLKSGYEVIATPLTYVVVTYLKRVEQLDVYDRGTNFTPFKFEAE